MDAGCQNPQQRAQQDHGLQLLKGLDVTGIMLEQCYPTDNVHLLLQIHQKSLLPDPIAAMYGFMIMQRWPARHGRLHGCCLDR